MRLITGKVRTHEPIEFWFDFSSGYAFFAAQEIDALSSRVGRAVLWRPYMLGTAYKVTGARGLSSTPLKRDYARRDWARIAEPRGLSFHLPPEHPRVALAATRASTGSKRRTPTPLQGSRSGSLKVILAKASTLHRQRPLQHLPLNSDVNLRIYWPGSWIPSSRPERQNLPRTRWRGVSSVHPSFWSMANRFGAGTVWG